MPAGHCPNLSGEYWSEGESTYYHASHEARLLSYRLAGYVPRVAKTRVTIEQNGNESLSVKVSLDGEILSQRTLLRANGDFTCNQEGLWLRPVENTTKDGTGIGHMTVYRGFNAAADHSLAGMERSSSVALVGWVIPLASSSDIQFHWVSPESYPSGEFFY